jgi:hypothetical protein
MGGSQCHKLSMPSMDLSMLSPACHDLSMLSPVCWPGDLKLVCEFHHVMVHVLGKF